MNIFPRAPTANFTAFMIAGLGIAALINAAFARRAETHNPPKGSFAEVDGLRLHYMEKGNGSPVVLLHGNQAMADDFEISGTFDLIAEKHRVIAFDRPGFGYSDRPRKTVWTPSAQADLIRKAFVKLGIEKPILVGHSWGTLVALTYAIEHPADTSGLLLLSGYYFPSKRLDVVFASLPAIPIIGDLLRYTFWPLLGWLTGPLLLKTVFAPSKVTEHFKRKFAVAMALRPSQIKATADDSSLMEPGAARLVERYRELTMPVAIMAGRGDKIIDIKSQQMRLRAVVQKSNLEVIDGTGHMLHYAYPEKVVAKIETLCTGPELAHP